MDKLCVQSRAPGSCFARFKPQYCSLRKGCNLAWKTWQPGQRQLRVSTACAARVGMYGLTLLSSPQHLEAAWLSSIKPSINMLSHQLPVTENPKDLVGLLAAALSQVQELKSVTWHCKEHHPLPRFRSVARSVYLECCAMEAHIMSATEVHEVFLHAAQSSTSSHHRTSQEPWSSTDAGEQVLSLHASDLPPKEVSSSHLSVKCKMAADDATHDREATSTPTVRIARLLSQCMERCAFHPRMTLLYAAGLTWNEKKKLVNHLRPR